MRSSKVLLHNQFDKSFDVEEVFVWVKCDFQVFGQESFKVWSIFSDSMCDNFIDWIQDKLYKGSLSILRRRLRLSLKLSGFTVEIVVSPKDTLKDVGVNCRESLLVLPCHELQIEDEPILCSCKDDIIESRRYPVGILYSQLLGTPEEDAVDFFKSVF